MHMFERLKLDLLREDAIEEILENTWISTELSLWDYFGLNNSTAKTVAKHLFDQTNGHPRSLFHALVQSKSLEDLLRYEGAFPLQGLNLVKFYDDSVRHKEQVLLLLEAAETQDRVNMLQLIPDRGERAVSLDVIANKSCVDWEGTAEEARVYIHPMVKSYLEGWLMPLAEYIEIDSTGYLRVLFVCCTSYDKDMSSKFKGKSHFVYQCKKSFPNIDEAILLNLETPKQRAAFFGVEDDLAPFVEVVVRKAEVGYSVT
ncbi:unnamed protein product [Aphanomyces euteiches]